MLKFCKQNMALVEGDRNFFRCKLFSNAFILCRPLLDNKNENRIAKKTIRGASASTAEGGIGISNAKNWRGNAVDAGYGGKRNGCCGGNGVAARGQKKEPAMAQ